MSKLTIKPVIPKITINRIHKTFLTQRPSSSLNLISFKKFSERSEPHSTSQHQYQQKHDDFLKRLSDRLNPRELIESSLKTEEMLYKCVKHGSVQEFQQMLSYLIAHECDDLIDLKAIVDAIVKSFALSEVKIEKLEVLFSKAPFFKSQVNLDLRDLMLIALNHREHSDTAFDILTHLVYKLTRYRNLEKADSHFRMSILYNPYKISQNSQALTRYLSKPFKEMIEKDFAKGMNLFITEGVDPTQKIEGKTPLYIAVESNSLSAVTLLLKHAQMSDEEEAVKLAFLKAGQDQINLDIVEQLVSAQGYLEIGGAAIGLKDILLLMKSDVLTKSSTFNLDLDSRIKILIDSYNQSKQTSVFESTYSSLRSFWDDCVSPLLFGQGVDTHNQENPASFHPVLTNTKSDVSEAVLMNSGSRAPKVTL